jgi:hypothetical protein
MDTDYFEALGGDLVALLGLFGELLALEGAGSRDAHIEESLRLRLKLHCCRASSSFFGRSTTLFRSRRKPPP